MSTKTKKISFSAQNEHLLEHGLEVAKSQKLSFSEYLCILIANDQKQSENEDLKRYIDVKLDAINETLKEISIKQSMLAVPIQQPLIQGQLQQVVTPVVSAPVETKQIIPKTEIVEEESIDELFD